VNLKQIKALLPQSWESFVTAKLLSDKVRFVKALTALNASIDLNSKTGQETDPTLEAYKIYLTRTYDITEKVYGKTALNAVLIHGLIESSKCQDNSVKNAITRECAIHWNLRGFCSADHVMGIFGYTDECEMGFEPEERHIKAESAEIEAFLLDIPNYWTEYLCIPSYARKGVTHLAEESRDLVGMAGGDPESIAFLPLSEMRNHYERLVRHYALRFGVDRLTKPNGWSEDFKVPRSLSEVAAHYNHDDGSLCYNL
jgi:hypothetical protein